MVKEKINSVRTYDEDGYRRRAACLCFKDESEQEILLVSSSKYKDRWVVPGGGIEPTEEARLAAEREALEEAGAKGHIGRKIGDFENIEKKHRTCLYAFIVTELLDDWEDAQCIGRQRHWFNIIEARGHLAHKPVQVSYLHLFPKDLNGVVKR